jgi:WD40 repeat protein
MLQAAWHRASSEGVLPSSWESGTLVVTPDGKHLAASGREVVIWDLAGPDLAPGPGFAPMNKEQSLLGLAVSPDGKLMAAGYHDRRGEDGVIVWDVATRQILRSRPTLLLNRLAFSPDSRLLACGSGGGHFLLDARTLQPQGLPIIDDGVQSVAFSPDGQLLAVATIFGNVSLRSVTTYDEIATLNHPDSTGGVMGRRLRVVFSPDGQSLLAVSGRTVLSWGLASAGERRVLYGNWSTVEGLVFSGDGRYLAIAHGGAHGTLTLRDASTGQLVRPPVDLPDATWADFSPDSTVLATVNAGRLGLWAVPALDELTNQSGVGSYGGCLAYSPDGKLIAACGASGLWVRRLTRHAAGREAGSELTLNLISHMPGHGAYLCFSPDGKRIAWAEGFYAVKLWDVNRQAPIPFHGPSLLAGWQSLGFLPDSRHLVMIDQNRMAEVWDVETGRRVFTLGETGEFAKSHVALSPDGRWLAGDHTTSAVAVWDIERRRRHFILPEEHGPIAHLTWNRDGSRLAIGMKDGRVVLWDLPQIRARLAALGLDW